MQKWTAFLFAALAVAAVAVIVGERPGKGGPAPASTSVAEAKDAGAPADGGKLADAGDAGEPGPPEDGSGTPESLFGSNDAGTTLLNGSAPPALAGDVPKSVVFGVILVQYKGAQAAPGVTRTREAALELAKQLAVEAKTDFKAALAKGDKGSLENAGRMPRGMLEPAPEFVLFSLPKDGVSEPVDTPRGYWIVHRIE
jgi:PPIC-type PPIASE domain